LRTAADLCGVFSLSRAGRTLLCERNPVNPIEMLRLLVLRS
jgi:hypothetical protein